MATYNENKQFAESVIDTDNLLDNAIDFIKSNLAPDDVFDKAALENWAEDNGYVEEQ